MTKKRILLFAGAAVALALLWKGFGAVNGDALEVTRPVRGDAVQAVYATGTVEASVMMPIAARTGARLMALNVDEGSEVTEGQVLAQLEDDDLLHTLEQLKAREDYTRKEYERATSLIKKKFISAEELDRARSEWEAASASVRAAEAQASYLRLVAPADGRIIKRDGEVGQMIPANQPVFWLSCCAPLRISAEVDEEDIALVQPGKPVLIRADAFPGKTFNGKVQSITPKGDPVARSYRVRIEFAEETPLLIGMTAETNIIVREDKGALLVPAGALDGDTVWRVEDGNLKKVPVMAGARGEKQAAIVSGISEQDRIVVRADARLKEGESVRTRLVDQTP
jgi:membrane fusion protein, multidrug efflux system